jgi:hypothetical protein
LARRPAVWASRSYRARKGKDPEYRKGQAAKKRRYRAMANTNNHGIERT